MRISRHSANEPCVGCGWVWWGGVKGRMEPDEQPDILSIFGAPQEPPEPEKKKPLVSPDQRIVNLKKSLRGITGSRSLWEVWRDWIEMAALSLSQSADRRGSVWKDREETYLRAAGRYDADQLRTMAEMLGELVLIFEDGGPRDVLGELFQELELASKWAGQFFTPVSLAEAMARMMLEDASKRIEERGWISISDVAVGAGALPIGAVKALLEMGYGPQHAVFFGQDVDAKAVHMAYVQLSLLGVPAVLFCADTLRRPMVEADWRGVGEAPGAVWYTPTFLFDGWHHRILRGRLEAP